MTQARELTPQGVERALALLDNVRETQPRHLVIPSDLLDSIRYSKPLPFPLEVEPRRFQSRRAAAEYLSPLFQPYTAQLLERSDFWSWLGMFYLADNTRIRNAAVSLLRRNESYVLHREGEHAQRRRYLHYLWSAWQLYEQHPTADYLLDAPLVNQSDIADRVFSYQWIFNSRGIVELICLLYTRGTETRSGFGRRPGGLRHLVRVLEQLERTYDVHGMTVEQLLRILPPPFDPWKPTTP